MIRVLTVVKVVTVVTVLAVEGQSGPQGCPHIEAIPNHNQLGMLTISDSSLLSIVYRFKLY